MFDARALEELAVALEGIAILGVLPRSPAALAGVRFGDVLLEMNGARVRSWADYVRATSERRDGMEAVVFRGGASIRLKLDTHASSAPPDYLAVVIEMASNGLGGARLDEGGPSN
jgi:S1-C subfamily serine protease